VLEHIKEGVAADPSHFPAMSPQTDNKNGTLRANMSECPLGARNPSTAQLQPLSGWEFVIRGSRISGQQES
jgi:hypothetical protein